MGFIPRGKAFEVITGPLALSSVENPTNCSTRSGLTKAGDTTSMSKPRFSTAATLTWCDQWWSCLPYRHWTQNRIEVEEHNALRAVVKITGSFALADSKENRLDYIARLTTYGGKTYFKFELTLLNRREAEFPLDELSLSFKLNLDLTQQKFIFGGEPQDYTGNFDNAGQAPCRRIRSACIRFPEQCREVARARARAWAGWTCRTASTVCLQR